jgi:hypothetical protein
MGGVEDGDAGIGETGPEDLGEDVGSEARTAHSAHDYVEDPI